MIAKRACLMTCLFFVNISFAKILKFEHKVTKESEHSFEKVCNEMAGKSIPLAQYANIKELDCMGQMIDVRKFCIKEEAANAYYTRALVAKKKKKVVCQSAKEVRIKYLCEKENDPYCKSEAIGCALFKKSMAYRLKLQYSYLSSNVPKSLTCYFYL